jgi:hypothetical protein
MKPVYWMVVSVSFLLWVATATAQAQTVGRGGSFSPSGSVGTHGGATGVGGLRGRAVNPNFNPPGSLSPFQRLNPPGSNSPSLNLNPRGSMFRPRYGADSNQQFGNSRSPIRHKSHKSALVLTKAQLELMSRPSLCELIGLSAKQLEDELARFENGSDWRKVLRLGLLRKISASESGHTLTDEDRQDLMATLDRFNKLTTDSRYNAVTQLAGFSLIHRSLTELFSADASDGRVPIAQQHEADGVESPQD